MARHLIALVAVVLVGIGVFLFVQVNADPVATPVATHTPAPLAAPAANGVLSPPIAPRPVLPAAPTTVEHAAAATAPSHALAATPEEANAARAQATAELRSRMRPQPMFKSRPDPKLDNVTKLATDAYDKGDLAKAKEIAAKVLSRFPGNQQMLHVMVGSACAEGNVATAQKYYGQMPPAQRAAMKKQCGQGTLTDPPP